MSNKNNIIGYIIETNHGILFQDKTDSNMFWLGGSLSLIKVAFFRDKKSAQRFAQKSKRHSNKKFYALDRIKWTRILPIFEDKE